MKTFGVVISIIAVILLVGIYEQLHISNLTPEQKLAYVEQQKLKDAQMSAKAFAEIQADQETKIEQFRIEKSAWSELRSDSDRIYWLGYKALPWMFMVFFISIILSGLSAFHRKFFQ